MASEPLSDRASREHQKNERLCHVRYLNDMSSTPHVSAIAARIRSAQPRWKMPDEYVNHLCDIDSTRSKIFSITQSNVRCHEIMQMNRGLFSLNYPSISVDVMRRKMFSRRVANLGGPNSIYSVDVVCGTSWSKSQNETQEAAI
ncbi:subtilisin-like protease SDD1-like protein [Trifolium pratense]|uniref:Subtilisin-like protease SDD1-like protein n=1 Tax=Trifolium pratense TaxID=57577 RepID=A0A2K3JV97_TRIPR|nr:subtilisin-like protease SDD1-like protein [Trifolium pratense]